MRKASVVWLLGILVLCLAGPLTAHETGRAATRLRGFDEVPAISSPGGGRFRATLETDSITWEMSYFNLRTPVQQAHIHFAQRGVNGGVMVFLCSNLSSAPAGVPACPPSPGEVSGVIHASDVVSSTAAQGQGISPGELSEVLRAIRAGIAYVNVHTEAYPAGEIRGQLSFDPDDDH